MGLYDNGASSNDDALAITSEAIEGTFVESVKRKVNIARSSNYVRQASDRFLLKLQNAVDVPLRGKEIKRYRRRFVNNLLAKNTQRQQRIEGESLQTFINDEVIDSNADFIKRDRINFDNETVETLNIRLLEIREQLREVSNMREKFGVTKRAPDGITWQDKEDDLLEETLRVSAWIKRFLLEGVSDDDNDRNDHRSHQMDESKQQDVFGERMARMKAPLVGTCVQKDNQKRWQHIAVCIEEIIDEFVLKETFKYPFIGNELIIDGNDISIVGGTSDYINELFDCIVGTCLDEGLIEECDIEYLIGISLRSIKQKSARRFRKTRRQGIKKVSKKARQALNDIDNLLEDPEIDIGDIAKQASKKGVGKVLTGKGIITLTPAIRRGLRSRFSDIRSIQKEIGKLDFDGLQTLEDGFDNLPKGSKEISSFGQKTRKFKVNAPLRYAIRRRRQVISKELDRIIKRNPLELDTIVNRIDSESGLQKITTSKGIEIPLTRQNKTIIRRKFASIQSFRGKIIPTSGGGSLVSTLQTRPTSATRPKNNIRTGIQRVKEVREARVRTKPLPISPVTRVRAKPLPISPVTRVRAKPLPTLPIKPATVPRRLVRTTTTARAPAVRVQGNLQDIYNSKVGTVTACDLSYDDDEPFDTWLECIACDIISSCMYVYVLNETIMGQHISMPKLVCKPNGSINDNSRDDDTFSQTFFTQLQYCKQKHNERQMISNSVMTSKSPWERTIQSILSKNHRGDSIKCTGR